MDRGCPAQIHRRTNHFKSQLIQTKNPARRATADRVRSILDMISLANQSASGQQTNFKVPISINQSTLGRRLRKRSTSFNSCSDTTHYTPRYRN
jgi:hypothetical protein